MAFLLFFVNVEINTSVAIKTCEKSYNRLLENPSVYGQQISYTSLAVNFLDYR